ncbi:MAG: alpha/beta hydrolase [Bacteroidia bacterium]|jgi:phospholipase/carboxylesterase|nr:alpha/beta hydrolase [Bacteroidia bacterium]
MTRILSVLCLLCSLILTACQAQTELLYKVVPARITSSTPAPILVLLHGWGSDENDLIGLSNSLPPDFIVVSVRAPYKRENGGYAWYELQFGNGVFKETIGQAAESARKINSLLPKLVKELHADPKRVFLGGFSQGAIMSLRVGLQAPYPVRGIVCLSGRFPPDLDLNKIPAMQKTKIPVFAAHGTDDKVISIADGRNIIQKLQSAGISVTAKEYPMGHQISKEELMALKAWLESFGK